VIGKGRLFYLIYTHWLHSGFARHISSIQRGPDYARHQRNCREYLAGIALVSVLKGVLLEWLLQLTQLSVDVGMTDTHGVLPAWLSDFSAMLLVPALRNRLLRFMRGG